MTAADAPIPDPEPPEPPPAQGDSFCDPEAWPPPLDPDQLWVDDEPLPDPDDFYLDDPGEDW